MMGTNALLSNIINNCSFFRSVLKNRILIALQPPNVNLRSETKKKLKDLNVPEPPKKPLTSYFRYLSERRPIIKKQHPQWTPIDITKQCAQDWRDMDPLVRHKYEEAYHKEVEIYNEKHQSFILKLSPEQAEALAKVKQEKQTDKSKRDVKKLQRELHKPKRPISNFAYFIKEKKGLPENSTKKFVDILKIYKDEWNNLSNDSREKYNKLHLEDKVRYITEMEKWESKMIKAGNVNIIRKDSRLLTVTAPKMKQDSKSKKSEDNKEKK